jgi:hypothetical protein
MALFMTATWKFEKQPYTLATQAQNGSAVVLHEPAGSPQFKQPVISGCVGEAASPVSSIVFPLSSVPQCLRG